MQAYLLGHLMGQYFFSSISKQLKELSLGKIKSDVDDLKKQLQLAMAFLKDAEQRFEDPDEHVKIWQDDLRNIIAQTEDTLDKYFLDLEESQWRQNQRWFVNYTSLVIDTFISRHNFASNFEKMKGLLSKIHERGNRLAIMDDTTGRMERERERVVDQAHRQALVFSSDENTVGIDSVMGEVVSRLMEGESKRSVVSLVGGGGIGKTTLAWKVYNAEAVRRDFDCRAWISVTQSYKIEEILRTLVFLIGGVRGDGESLRVMDLMELIGRIKENLQSKTRFLLVFDDVWDEGFWKVVKNVMPFDGNGSRIIITTRVDSVAACCSDYVKRLEPLSMEMSSALFRSKVFPDDGRPCPPELESLCVEFVRMCGGFPLAIVAATGLLSTREKTVSEWQELLQNFHLELHSNNELGIVSKVLALSFRALPNHLMNLFLYFSIFPKESLIPNDKLVKLWIADGFIDEKEGMTLEQVAQECLDELICRNIVQASKGFYGLEKFCSVHGLMHEMARKMADKHHFCHIREERNSNFRGKSRRLSIRNVVMRNVLETIDDSQVRSVFLSNITSFDNSFLITLFGKHKLLTLLDFENVPLNHLPDEVGNLFNLKYLSLKNTKVKRLPKTVGKLQKLQTLDVTNTLLVELPIRINKLQNLRHLLASRKSKSRLDSNKGVRIYKGIGCLEKLQSLMTLEAHLSGMDVIEELQMMRQLRILSISGLTSELASTLCACIGNMIHLESLSLYSKNRDECLDIQNISYPPPHLNRLVLKGLLQSFPQWISRLQNLSVLCLSLSRMAVNPLPCLCLLPKLESLWLYQAYEGAELHFMQGGFEKLKLLVLREMAQLEVVKIEQDALPALEELRIGPSQCLREALSGIQYLRNLQVLSLYDMPNELVLSLQPNGGSNYEKIKKVTSVMFWYKVMGRDYISYRLGNSGLLELLQGLATNTNQIDNYNRLWSFSYSDSEGDSASTSVAQQDDIPRLSSYSDRLSFFTDDIED